MYMYIYGLVEERYKVDVVNHVCMESNYTFTSHGVIRVTHCFITQQRTRLF